MMKMSLPNFPVTEKTKAEIWGEKIGFVLASALFFAGFNFLANYWSGNFKKGAIGSGVIMIFLLMTYFINRKYKKWTW